MNTTMIADNRAKPEEPEYRKPQYLKELPEVGQIDELLRLMKKASKDLKFEYAAFLRDEIKQIEKNLPFKILGKKKSAKTTRFMR